MINRKFNCESECLLPSEYHAKFNIVTKEEYQKLLNEVTQAKLVMCAVWYEKKWEKIGNVSSNQCSRTQTSLLELKVKKKNRRSYNLFPSFSLLPVDRSVGPVGENPGNKVEEIKTESFRKSIRNFNFQWTKTLYQNNWNNIAFFFTLFKGYRYN